MEKIEIKHIDEYVYHDQCDNGLNVYMWVNEKVNNFYNIALFNFQRIIFIYNLDIVKYSSLKNIIILKLPITSPA